MLFLWLKTNWALNSKTANTFKKKNTTLKVFGKSSTTSCTNAMFIEFTNQTPISLKTTRCNSYKLLIKFKQQYQHHYHICKDCDQFHRWIQWIRNIFLLKSSWMTQPTNKRAAIIISPKDSNNDPVHATIPTYIWYWPTVRKFSLVNNANQYILLRLSLHSPQHWTHKQEQPVLT